MKSVLIVAHGQPSDPAPAEGALAGLAAAVQGLMPGWTVGSATLATPGGIAAALARLGPKGLVFPMFMAGGWFTRVQLPAKLAEAGALTGPEGWQVTEPFGCLETVQALAAEVVSETGADEAIIAAHGSFKSPVPAAIAGRVAAGVAASGLRAAAGFIDQEPQLASLSGFGPRSVCLPFFAAEGGHVTDDIPAALAKAGFQGRLLPALGLDDRVPGLIADALQAGRLLCQGACRWG
jgi:sirohydrochlorin ferrochelatase